MDLPPYLELRPGHGSGFTLAFATALGFAGALACYYGETLVTYFLGPWEPEPGYREANNLLVRYLLATSVLFTLSYLILYYRWLRARHAPHAPAPLMGCKKCETAEKARIRRRKKREEDDQEAYERELAEGVIPLTATVTAIKSVLLTVFLQFSVTVFLITSVYWFDKAMAYLSPSFPSLFVYLSGKSM
jgi:hypothetical protein